MMMMMIYLQECAENNIHSDSELINQETKAEKFGLELGLEIEKAQGTSNLDATGT